MKIHIIQHAPFEGPGIILDWASKHNHQITFTHIYREEVFPELSYFDFLIILGGAMGSYEEHLYPWLKKEKRFINEAINANKIVLGICLGAQLIANVLGAKVYPQKQKEIGWWKVNATTAAKPDKLFRDFPPEYMAFHWHGDTFDLPRGAILMASSEATQNQAFVYDSRVVGLQFHFEVTENLLDDFLKDGGEELKIDKYVQNANKINQGYTNITNTNRLMISLLQNLSK